MSDNATLVERLMGLYRAEGSELLQNAAARIAELEAENERLVEQVRQFTADLDDSTISVGEAYAYRSEDHGPGKKP